MGSGDRLLKNKTHYGHDQETRSTLLVGLPQDLMQNTLSFLSGYDLLALSHVNRWLYYGPLVGDADIWERIAPQGSERNSPSAKQRYVTRRAVRFHGAPNPERGGAIPMLNAHEIERCGSFSVDLVFALMPANDEIGARAGGILLGAQSRGVTNYDHAKYHLQFIHIDVECNLYCSMMGYKPIVAKNLAFERWYHVALVFEMTSYPNATQRVYVNGELVNTVNEHLHDEWDDVYYAQLGTGCITGAQGLGSCGWYSFNGLVDDCRFWNRALDDDEVCHLVNGRVYDPTACKWSMWDVARQSAVGTVSLVRSTSPAERTVSHVESVKVLSSGTIPSEHIITHDDYDYDFGAGGDDY